jgi:predicted DNA-binding transcriptional regulator AlpA
MTKSDQMKTRALAALLDSNTLTEAAEKAEISRKTLYNYMRDDSDFAKAYQAAQEQLVVEQMDALASDRERAKATILALMEDREQPAAIRLKAAQSIFDIVDAQQTRATSIVNGNVISLEEKELFPSLFF